MKYHNPIIRGCYPDPSVCKADDSYYMACSSFQYFPGVPLFESKDLVNWVQIGHALTRQSQIKLDQINSSGGVFAPTLRHHNGRFYLTTTNDTTRQNFIVWTDDIYGEWSEPLFIDQGGIDPDLFFEGNRTYFMSNGTDEQGRGVILQCEIDIVTGEKLTPSLPLWQGTGGRYLESPHMYHIHGWYYLMAAEGGTEYGHMITYARSRSLQGPFQAYPHNPVLTNRNLGGYEIQGIGHGDLIEDDNGNGWIVHLGFRQMGQWSPYHHLGREVFLAPVTFHEDGWFTAGDNGTTRKAFETDRLPSGMTQVEKRTFIFENTNLSIDWCYLRHPHIENYEFQSNRLTLKGTEITLDQADSPTLIGLRQKDFLATITCNVSLSTFGEAGITLYMDENHHYDLAISHRESGIEVIERLNIGSIRSIQKALPLTSSHEAKLIIHAHHERYIFSMQSQGQEFVLGEAQTKYLSSEVAGGFTGVIIGLYATGKDSKAKFTDFLCEYL
ncbi:glycoside hydrolase family 43 protein [Paenibacillus sp. SAF-054]|uniref:glycoside hydrolase family 43 protein n=1 Tax=unclassified Paenibacillus TaxID=185978 RepID=UPI003F8086E9